MEKSTSNGYIKLDRKILDWEWYSDINTKVLFIHCLLKANFQDKKWQGIEVKRGSFITSYEKLSQETGLSVRSVRTSLNKLISTCEITKKSSSKNSTLIINNYDKFQSIDTQIDKQATNKRQTSDKQATTTNNEKKEKKEKNNIPFENFYSLYPVKKSKVQALKNWNKLSEDIQSKCVEVVNSKEFKDWVSKQDIKYIKHPSTWLSQGCWEDELIEPVEKWWKE